MSAVRTVPLGSTATAVPNIVLGLMRIAESSEPYLFDERAPDRSRDKARVALAVKSGG